MHIDKKKQTNYLIYIGIAIFLVFIYKRCNNWHDRLAGDNGKLTVAHVFKSKKVKSSTYYKYIYKVDNNYYSESTSGSNVESFEIEPVQCFLVAFDQTDPTVHTVIWSFKFKDTIPLGTEISNIANKNELIKEHTIGWNGLSPRASLTSREELNE